MQKAHSNPLTRKLGPLPVYAYALIALAAWFVLRGSGTAAAQTGLPYTGTSGSAAQRPASGQGSPADNGNADLLAALGANNSASDALLAALQGGGMGVAGGTAGSGGGGGTQTAAMTAPTVVGDGAPAASTPTDVTGPGYGADPTIPTVFGPNTPDPADPYAFTVFGPTPDLVDRYLASHNIDTFAPASVTAPTPYATVAPAPVDTSSVTVAPPETRLITRVPQPV